MKALNILYKDENSLSDFISSNILNIGESCLVRIHASTSDAEKCVAISRQIRNILPDSKIAGLSVSGVIFNGEILEDEILISFNDFELGSVETKIFTTFEKTDSEIATEILDFSKEFDAGFGFLFANIVNNNLVNLLEIINEENKDLMLVGGKSGYFLPDGSIESFVFNEDGFYKSSIIISFVSREFVLPYSNIVTGHPAISEVYEITEADGEYIDKINGEPLDRWLHNNLGLSDFSANDDWENTVSTDILLRFPFVVEDKNSTTAFIQYENDTNRFKLYYTKLDKGTKIRLGYLSPLRSAEQWQEICSDLQMVSAESTFCYSCLFRKLFSNSIAKWEMNPFKDTGICGAFLMGEVGTKDSQIQALNGACSFFTLAEKENYLNIDLGAFDSIELILDANEDIIEKIKSAKEVLKSEYDSRVFEKLINYEQSVKQRLLSKGHSDLGCTLLKSMTDFLKTQSKRLKQHICLVTIENIEELDDDKKAKAKFLANFNKINEFLTHEYPKTSFNYYLYDEFSIIITIDDAILEETFIDIMRALYANCGSTNASETVIINNFTYTLTGLSTQKLYECAKDETVSISRRRFRLCDDQDDIQNDLHEEFKLVATLNEIIKSKRIIPYFQGIYDNRKNCFYCYEALMRLETLDGKILFPGDFMDISRKYHLYLSLSYAMIKKVFDLFKDRSEIITMNISASDILSEEFREMVYTSLESMDNPSHFVFELLETERFDDLEILREFVHKVRRFGVKIAADDFGSGYANFIELGNIELDFIKINGSLTKLLGTDQSYNKILESISYMGKKMKVELIAEYVETAAMQRELIRNGVHYSQGYLFSKPMSLDELNVISLENQVKLDNFKENDSKEFANSFFDPKKSKKNNNFLYFGGITIGIITLLALFYFATFNQREVENIADTFLVEIATGLSDRVELVVEDSKTALNTTAVVVESYIDDDENLQNIIEQVQDSSRFDSMYIAVDEGEVLKVSGDTCNVSEKDVYGQASDEVQIIAPVLCSQNNTHVIFTKNLYHNGEKYGEIYGVYEVDTFKEILSLETFGGEAFYHLCKVDGTPILLSGNNDNLFKDGDMYDFIGTLDIYNGHTIDTLRNYMENGHTALLKYKINNEDRSAVMTTIDNTDWCVVSIVQSEVTESMLSGVSISTVIFASVIALSYGVYFVINIIFARQHRKVLLEALESSYVLTNSLQASIETDSLTRTYSRATAAQKISEALAFNKNSNHSLVVLDIDNFKYINDFYGQEYGDIYLQDFVSAVRATLRAGDIIGRLGGDEFIVLLKDVGTKAETSNIMDKICQNIINIEVRGIDLKNITASAGVVITDPSESYDDLVNKANKALNRAKKLGKNEFVIYE